MLSPSTLYYFFSTVAQVMAAAVALIAVLVHFRIIVLRDFLVGDGQSIIDRRDDFREEAYKVLDTKHYNRLNDSVSRKDIGGIKEILKFLSEKEKEEEISMELRPKGFQWIFIQFENIENQILEMTVTSKRSFIVALLTSFYSIIAILFVDVVSKNIYSQIILVGIDILLLSVCGFYLSKGIRLSFDSFTNRFPEC